MSCSSPRLVPIVLLVAGVAGGCAPGVVGGPDEVRETIVVDEGGRAAAIRGAREALAEPVPRVVAEARAFRDVLDGIWTASGDSALRAELVELADPSALLVAADDLAAVELAGDTEDLVAVREQVALVVGAARDAAAAAPAELVDLPLLVLADQRLAALPPVWDEPGSFSQQVARLEELSVTAAELALELDRPAALPCTGVWQRRVEAAERVVDRTATLLELVRGRDGEAFDEMRATLGEDPFGTGGRSLGDLDAEAGACWGEDSAVPDRLATIDEAVRGLTAALDPPDLRAP